MTTVSKDRVAAPSVLCAEYSNETWAFRDEEGRALDTQCLATLPCQVRTILTVSAMPTIGVMFEADYCNRWTTEVPSLCDLVPPDKVTKKIVADWCRLTCKSISYHDVVQRLVTKARIVILDPNSPKHIPGRSGPEPVLEGKVESDPLDTIRIGSRVFHKRRLAHHSAYFDTTMRAQTGSSPWQNPPEKSEEVESTKKAEEVESTEKAEEAESQKEPKSGKGDDWLAVEQEDPEVIDFCHSVVENYTHSATMSVVTACKCASFAHRYDLPEVLLRCERELQQCVTLDNVVELKKFATQFDLGQLSATCDEFIVHADVLPKVVARAGRRPDIWLACLAMADKPARAAVASLPLIDPLKE